MPTRFPLQVRLTFLNDGGQPVQTVPTVDLFRNPKNQAKPPTSKVLQHRDGEGQPTYMLAPDGRSPGQTQFWVLMRFGAKSGRAQALWHGRLQSQKGCLDDTYSLVGFGDGVVKVQVESVME